MPGLATANLFTLNKDYRMKNTLYILLFLSFPILAKAQTPFSNMEVSHIRVATPGLFAGSKKLTLHFDSIASNGFVFPLPGAKLISAYGGKRGHSGADIKTCAKDTIRCAFDGVVRLAKPYAAYGNVVVVRHDCGLETIYSHNHTNFVSSGDTIKAGHPIGLTGRTGRATTEHLHLEVRLNGQHFNPDLLFDFRTGELRKGAIQCTQSGKGVQVKAVKP